MPFFRILILFSILGLAGCQYQPPWGLKGPHNLSGPIKQIVVDKNDSQKLYACAENGGLWVIQDYTDENSRWRAISDNLENLQIRGFDVSSRNPELLVLGNGFGNIHLSYDAGQEWIKLGKGGFGYIRKIAIDDALGSILHFYVAASSGLYKVEVRGTGPNELLFIDTISRIEILDFVIDRKSENVRYYAARNEGVFRSVSYGNSWQLIKSISSSNMIKLAVPPSDGTMVIKERDTLHIGNQTVSSFNIKRIITGQRGGNSDIGYRNPFGGRRGDWCHAIAVDPENSDRIVTGVNWYNYSDDGGLTWVRDSEGCHEDPHHILFNGEDILMATDGGIYSVDISAEGTVQCNDLNNGLATYQFYRVGVNNNNAVGNIDHNGIKYTRNLNDTKPTWENVTRSGYGNNGLENDFVYKDIKDPDRFFVLFQSQDLLRLKLPYDANSNDLYVLSDPNNFLNPFSGYSNSRACTKNGVSYTNCNQFYNGLNYPLGTIAQDPRPESNTMLASTFASADNRIDSLDVFQIKLSRNSDRDPTGGSPGNCGDTNGRTFCYTPAVSNFSTWKVNHDNGNVPIVSLAFSRLNNGKVYALDESGKVLMKNDVNDNGEQWNEQGHIGIGPGELMRELVVDWHDEDCLMAVSHDAIYRSTDAGQSWANMNFIVPERSKINSICQHDKNSRYFYIGTDRGVFQSKNIGRSWTRFGKYLPNATVMQVFMENEFLYAVTFGRGLWRVQF